MDILGRDISGCESLIMLIVWNHEGELSTPQLIEEMRTQFKRDYARTTVVTFLQRLIDKGYVTTTRKGRVSFIKPAVTRQEYGVRMLLDAQKYLFQEDPAEVISTLCSKQKLTKDQVTAIQAVTDKLK